MALLAGLGAIFLASVAGSALPDLQVTVEAATNQTDNAQVAVNVTVMNTGDSAAANVSVALFIDGNPSSPPLEFPALAAGGTYSLSPTFPLPCGYHNVTAAADPSNLVAEQSESNNNGSSVAQVLPFAGFSTALAGNLGNYNLVANASSSHGCAPLSFTWEAAPGGNFSGEQIGFSVPAGNVTLALTATSPTDTTLVTRVTQSINVPNRAPELSVVAASPSVPTGTPMILTIVGSDVDGWVETYFADFGDGNSTGLLAEMVSHRYLQSGEFVITVRITDNVGGYAVTSVTVAILNRAPVARVDPPYWYGELTDEVVLNGTSSVDPEGGPLSFTWQFGDGQNATGTHGVHTYGSPGVYQAVLTVTDDHGASHSTTVRVQVFAPHGESGSGGVLTAVFLGFVVVVTVIYLASLRRRQVDTLAPPAANDRQEPK